MSFSTPTLSRMMPWGLKTTPNNRQSTLRSSTRSNSTKNDVGLALKHVIGTTANSPCAINSLPAASQVAFTAGAAAVIAVFDDDLKSTQRFYRARPTAVPLNPTPVIYAPSTPTGGNTEFRTRAAGNLRDATSNSPYGASNGDWADSPGGRSWSARERVKAATCVSLSPDGKYLAVGETGYRPRVLIFSTSKEASSDDPLTCLTDHTFGVRAVAFSPDSQYLASLGDANDGFLYIWKINNRNGAAVLHSSNKCTTSINQMVWMGKSLITVGTRHVKIWRLDSPTTPIAPLKSFLSPLTAPGTPTGTSKILSGRNCLLGPLLDKTFTAVVPLTNYKAIVCSEEGDISLLDDSDSCQSFTKVAEITDGITAAATVGLDAIVFASRGGQLRTMTISSLLRADLTQPDIPAMNRNASDANSLAVIAMTSFGNRVVTFDVQNCISISRYDELAKDVVQSAGFRMPAHGSPVLGVRRLPLDSESGGASFLTWSADGTILCWSSDGMCETSLKIEPEQVDDNGDGFSNELRVLCVGEAGKSLMTGDRCGVLSIVDRYTGARIFGARAHSAEITDIAVLDGPHPIVATCGRDRTVQVFQRLNEVWELSQTLDEHVGAVTGVVFSNDGQYMISSSADRTIVVRQALSTPGSPGAVFSILRTITLKAAPASMALSPLINHHLLVSATDRTVQTYDLDTGKLKSSFKAGDTDGGDAVIITSLLYIPNHREQDLIAGLSSTDKSLRLYDTNGALCGRDWGHTAGVTDLALITSQEDDGVQNLVTVAADGTIFIWTIGAKGAGRTDLSRSMELMGDMTEAKGLLINKPPLRRVLSQTEMARYRQTSPEHDPTTPTIGKSSRSTITKRHSRFSLSQAPRLDPIPVRNSSTFDISKAKGSIRRSPSPPSPRNKQRLARNTQPKPIAETRTLRGRPSLLPANSTEGAKDNELAAATEQICRSLRTYRRKLTNSSGLLGNDMLREVEKELGLTAKAIGEKASKNKGKAEEQAMVQLLSQYSEKLLEMLDEKFATTLSLQQSQGPSGSSSKRGSSDDALTASPTKSSTKDVEEEIVEAGSEAIPENKREDTGAGADSIVMQEIGRSER